MKLRKNKLFLIFAEFVRALLNALLATLKSVHDDELFFLRLAAFCAFLTWLLCSFLESFYVQFSAWITILMAIISIKNSPDKGQQHV